MTTHWEYASDTKQIYAPEDDSDGGKGVAENYGDEAQGWLLAAAPALLAACQEVRRWIECDTLVDLDELSDDCKEVLGIVKAAIAAAVDLKAGG